MLWSKLNQWTESVQGTLHFLFLSQLRLYGICVKIFTINRYYFKELHNNQEYYWLIIYRAGPAVVSTITSNNIIVSLSKGLWSVTRTFRVSKGKSIVSSLPKESCWCYNVGLWRPSFNLRNNRQWVEVQMKAGRGCKDTEERASG